MKKSLFILFSFFLLLGCQKKEYSINDLEEKEGLFYIKGTKKIYNGQTTNYLGGEITAINFFEKGDHRLGISFYPNGNKQYEIEFKNGKENGYYREYLSNGYLNYEVYIINGIQTEEKKIYYETGDIMSKFDSLGNSFSYYRNGKIRSKTVKGKQTLYYNRKGKEVSEEEVEPLIL